MGVREMIFKIDITADVDDAKARRRLKRILNKTKNMKPAWQQVGNYAKKVVIENIDEGGRPKKFAPLSPIYAKWKAAHGYTDKILIRSHGNGLINSFHRRTTNYSARVYTSLKYAAAHQEGIDPLPARKFMPDSEDRNIPPFDDKSMRHIREILKNFILR